MVRQRGIGRRKKAVTKRTTNKISIVEKNARHGTNSPRIVINATSSRTTSTNRNEVSIVDAVVQNSNTSPIIESSSNRMLDSVLATPSFDNDTIQKDPAIMPTNSPLDGGDSIFNVNDCNNSHLPLSSFGNTDNNNQGIFKIRWRA